MVDPVHGIRAQRGVAVGELVGRAVQDPLGAGQDNRPDLVLNLGLRWVDCERTDVAPVEREGAPTGHEQTAGVADVVVQLVGRTDLGKLLVHIEGRGRPRVVRQRLHIVGVEERALLCPFALQVRRRDRDPRPVRLRAALHGQT